MICCDTCPYWPTCEELDDFDTWGQADDDFSSADEQAWGELDPW